MTQTLSHPTPLSRRARWLLASVSVLWWVMWLALALLAAAWAFVAFYLVPHIGDYRQDMERLASKKLGLPVRIAAVSATRSLVPQITMQQVVVSDKTGRAALQLPSVLATVTPRALLRSGFTSITLNNPDLEIRRDAQGRIFVGGIDFSEGSGGDGETAANWFFSLPRFAVEAGSLRWTDEKRAVETVSLTDVSLRIRNSRSSHVFALAATPQANWGERFAINARFSAPLLEQNPGRWDTWSGTIFTDMPYVDVAQLDRYLDAQLEIHEGSGAVRVWADWDQGSITGVTADVGIAKANLRLKPDLQPLHLLNLQGRLQGSRRADSVRVGTRELQFTTADGLVWPGGNMDVQITAQGKAEEKGVWSADNLDLHALRQIAASLPLAQKVRNYLDVLEPQGLITHAQLDWQGSMNQPAHYQAKGSVRRFSLLPGNAQTQTLLNKGIAPAGQSSAQSSAQLSALAAAPGAASLASSAASSAAPALASAPAAAASAAALRSAQPLLAQAPAATANAEAPVYHPGVNNADLDFRFDEREGESTVRIIEGWVEFPGVFAEPRIALDNFNAQLQWQRDGDALAVQAKDVLIANADVNAQAQARWHTDTTAGAPRFPGVLDLSGTITQAEGNRVWRYLPLVIPQKARDYVQNAVKAGTARQGEFTVKGNLRDFPFATPDLGSFRIAAQVQGAYYDFVPKYLLDKGDAPWPPLTQLDGELIFEGAGMQVRNATGFIDEMQAEQLEATIADLEHTVVQVKGQLKGDLASALKTVSTSAVSALMNHALVDASGTGVTQVALLLDLPINDLDKSSVLGDVLVQNASIKVSPEAPHISGITGSVRFNEQGFVLNNISGQSLGGTVRVSGGMGPLAGRRADNTVAIQAQGTAAASQLKQKGMPDALAALAPYLEGSTPYDLQLQFKPRHTDVLLTSSLQGMAVNLPAPLGKAAASALPLRYENTVQSPAQAGAAAMDKLQIDWGRAANAVFWRELGAAQPVVRRGSITVGLAAGEEVAVPESGVQAVVRAAQVDVDQWQRLLKVASGAATPGASAGSASRRSYLPTVFDIKTPQLTWQGRTLTQLALAGTRAGGAWKAQMDAQEIAGNVEYREGEGDSAGQVVARLARFNLTPAQTTELEDALASPPEHMPALDIVVDDLTVRGKQLGRVEIEATNHGSATAQLREWRLNKFNIKVPEATLNATGAWFAAAEGQPRRTALNFTWDVQDSGKLLARLGQKDVLALGKGVLEGQVSWQGSPLSPHYPSMNGKLQLNMGNGRFLKADPGIAKLLGVLSLQALPRRLALDFRDVFSNGFVFDFVRGDVSIKDGVASTNNLQMKGVNAAVLMEGQAHIANETQDLHVVVVPEINAGTASLIATAINPAVGLGTFLAQWILRKPLGQATTQEFAITGTWADPKVERLARKPAPASTMPGSDGGRERARAAQASASAPAAPAASASPKAESAASGAKPDSARDAPLDVRS